jgi:hypothetical protein
MTISKPGTAVLSNRRAIPSQLFSVNVLTGGGSGDLGEPYHDPAVGSVLPSRIRKALEPLRATRRRVVEMDDVVIEAVIARYAVCSSYFVS